MNMKLAQEKYLSMVKNDTEMFVERLKLIIDISDINFEIYPSDGFIIYSVTDIRVLKIIYDLLLVKGENVELMYCCVKHTY